MPGSFGELAREILTRRVAEPLHGWMCICASIKWRQATRAHSYNETTQQHDKTHTRNVCDALLKNKDGATPERDPAVERVSTGEFDGSRRLGGVTLWARSEERI